MKNAIKINYKYDVNTYTKCPCNVCENYCQLNKFQKKYCKMSNDTISSLPSTTVTTNVCSNAAGLVGISYSSNLNLVCVKYFYICVCASFAEFAELARVKVALQTSSFIFSICLQLTVNKQELNCRKRSNESGPKITKRAQTNKDFSINTRDAALHLAAPSSMQQWNWFFAEQPLCRNTSAISMDICGE